MAKKPLSPKAGQNVAKYIYEHLGETLPYTTIDELCGTTSSKHQYNLIVGPLLKDGVLTVQNKKVMRGNDEAPIHNAYSICDRMPNTLTHSQSFMRGGANMGTMSTEVADLNPLLTENGFLAKNLEAAKAWKPELIMFGTWLDAHPEPLEPVIVEERSFEVFRNEKLLLPKAERRGGRTLNELINNTGLMPRLYLKSEARQELVYYVPRTMRRTLSILIVENHAPFVHVQEELARGTRVFFGRRVDGVVYGKGSVVASEETLRATEGMFANGCLVRYLYWGDIDRPGIEVYERLASFADVEPLVPAYQAMIAHAGEELPVSTSANMPPHMGVNIARALEPHELEVYMRVIACGLRIPQEAVPPSAYAGPRGARRLTETLRRGR